MKRLMIVCCLALTSTALLAQRPDFSAQCKKEMQKLAYLVGDWKGQAVTRTQAGELKLEQTEHIEWKMDGVLLSIEGIGKDQGKIAFHAMAMVNYDVAQQQFKFKSYVKEGYTTDAYFKIIEENKFEWGFDIPAGGKSRYFITLDPAKKTWTEIGEYSRDGSQWMKFIELNLNKQ